MSIRSDYFKYLTHLGKTVTVRELFENPYVPDMIALRHDVDYDLDLAIEMSYWERESGIRSTYFLLHSAPYWNDLRFIEKCLQIQDFGHEIGLHLNILAEWMRCKVDNLASYLERLLASLRKSGIRVTGVSAHGDRLCYERQFVNYWCFSELRPSDPVIAESGISAEGIPVKEENFQIRYPESHRITRGDDNVFDLWSISMKGLGFDYDATHVPYDSYYTDSGGRWHRSPDPGNHILTSGRHQILMHPIYWRGPQKIYFFLSAARSGSKWLANFLEQATPLRARHEFTLNHRFVEGKLVPEKHTSAGFNDLIVQKVTVRELMIEARTWIDEIPGDYAEANVYLERFLPLMEEVFPDAMLIHLYRDPKDVARSIVNRDWYDTPEDCRHPVMEVDGWGNLTQFEKACWYVRKTNETLLRSCQYRIAFEKMVSDFEYLTKQLKLLDIPVFPRLAREEFSKKINVNVNSEFPNYNEWPEEYKAIFHSICDPINKVLGYETLCTMLTVDRGSVQPDRGMHDAGVSKEKKLHEVVLEIDFRDSRYDRYSTKDCEVRSVDDGIEIIPEVGKHAHFLMGGGTWDYLKKGEGWEPEIGYYYQGVLELEFCQDVSVQLFCLMYDASGSLVVKRSLGIVRHDALPFKFSFKARSDARRFNIVVYVPKSDLPGRIKLRKACIEKVLLRNFPVKGNENLDRQLLV